ncbi:MAG: peroxiredoxin family protein [Gammaproteobacteria bacterium]|nr:peroxiredoxin family protein [Gammaproteobacteria bacterium]
MNRQLATVFVLMFALLPATGQAFQFLKDFQGNIKSLTDYTGKGKWTVVMMWAHDCHVCNQEAHQYVKFHTAHKDRDAIVLGISMDGLEKKKEAESFVQRHKLNFDNLYGEPEALAEAFENLTGVSWFGTPTFLFFNPKGEIMAQQVGAVPPKLIEQFMVNNP